MRIGIFTDAYLPQIGGVSTASHLIKEYLLALGHEAFVITPSDPDEKPETNVIRIPSIPFVSAKRLALFCSPYMYKKIKKLDFDLVHSQTEFAMGDLARRISKALNIPQVHTFHTLYEDWLKGQLGDGMSANVACGFIRHFTTAFCDSVDRIIVPTEKTRSVLLSQGVTTPLQILPTGIELDRFSTAVADQRKRLELRTKLNISADDFVLLYLGRISEEKGIDELLSYVPALLRNEPRLSFVLVGAGPQLEEYKAKSVASGMNDRIKFVGAVSPAEVPYYYAMADVFCSASRSETQGLTYIEAMAAGLPLLVVNDSCLAGVFSEAENGFSFKNETEFNRGLTALIEQPDLILKMSESARRSSERFSVNIFIDKIIALYENEIEKYNSNCDHTVSYKK